MKTEEQHDEMTLEADNIEQSEQTETVENQSEISKDKPYVTRSGRTVKIPIRYRE